MADSPSNVTTGIKGELLWTDQFDTKVGNYPIECLPTGRTIYHYTYTIEPRPALGAPAFGGTPLGTAIIGSIFPGGFGADSVSTYLTQHVISFAQTEYRINQPIIVTQEMINRGVLSMPSYIFDVVCVTPEPIEIPPKIINPIKVHSPGPDPKIPMKLLFGGTAKWSIVDVSYPQPPIPLQGNAIPVQVPLLHPLIIDENSGVITIFTSNMEASTVIEITVKAENSIGSDTVTFTIKLTNEAVPANDQTVPKEELEDLLFKSLFELKTQIQNNLNNGINPNFFGIYYRLDSGMPKSSDIMQGIGTPAATSFNYNDGSSKEIKFNALNVTVGQTLYVTYVAVREHYFRQIIDVSWSAIDVGLFGFVAFPNSLRAANFKFYTWDSPVGKTSGWRCVETFGFKPNITADILVNNQPFLANFPYGDNNAGLKNYSYMPNNIMATQIMNSINTKTDPVSTIINLPFELGGTGYQLNNNITPLNEQTWYVNADLKSPATNYKEVSDYCIFNVSQEALKKRDIDKWAIPAELANVLSETIKNGTETNFPFMDDPAVDEPFNGVTSTLNSANYKIDVLKSTPHILNLSNAFQLTGNIGAIPGIFQASNGTSFGTIIYAVVSSNIIEEPMKKGTHALVERYAIGGQAARFRSLVTVECKSNPQAFVTCAADKEFENSYIVTTNEYNLLSYKKMTKSKFRYQRTRSFYDPVNGGIDQKELSTSQITFDTYGSIGTTGIFGEELPTFPMKVCGFQHYGNQNLFREYFYGTNNAGDENRITQFDFKEIITSVTPNGLLIQLGEIAHIGYFMISFEADREYEIPATFFFMTGTTVTGVIDSVGAIKSGIPVPSNLKGDDYEKKEKELSSKRRYHFNIENSFWMQCDSILVKFDTSKQKDAPELKIENPRVNILSVKNEYAQDYSYVDFEVNKVENFPIYNGAIFVETDMATTYLDNRGHFYVLFNDKSDGISCVHSHIDDIRFNLQASVMPKINGVATRNPLLIKADNDNGLFLFFQNNDNIYCTFFNMADLNFEDAFNILPPETEIRNTPCYVAAGNNDLENISLLTNGETRLRMGASTMFSNTDVSTPFFTAYQNKLGEIRLLWLDNSGLLQCHFSADNGISWNDLWVCLKYGQEGLLNQLEEEFGRRVGGYRLGVKIHPQIKTVDQAGPQSPTAFYSSKAHKVFLYYVYKNCLLCSIYDDPLNCFSFNEENNCYDTFQKYLSEKPVYFVDGDASQIADEIIVNQENKNNIIFKHQDAANSFTSYRSIIPQRVAVYEMENGFLRVIYKTADGFLKAAHFDGLSFLHEDMFSEDI